MVEDIRLSLKTIKLKVSILFLISLVSVMAVHAWIKEISVGVHINLSLHRSISLYNEKIHVTFSV